MKNKAKKSGSPGGFTLVELLMVIAIIGILAGVILINTTSQRQRARAVAALQTLHSVMPYAVNCYLKNVTVNNPGAATGGGFVCGTSGPVYPTVGSGSTQGCSYAIQNNPIRVNCAGSFNVQCTYQTDARCVLNE